MRTSASIRSIRQTPGDIDILRCHPDITTGRHPDIVVHTDVYVRYRKVLRGTAFIIVEGIIERQGLVTNVVAREIRPMVSTIQ